MSNITFGSTAQSMGRRTKLRNVSYIPVVKRFIDMGIKKKYQEAMSDSNFCLVTEGDTPSSRHLFDAILSGCIPFENIFFYEFISIQIYSDRLLQDA